MRMWTYLAPAYPTELFQLMADRIGAELVVGQGGSGPHPDDDPFRDGRADLGWICSTSFAELAARPAPSVREVGLAWVPDGEPDARYHGVLVVRRGSIAATLRDLEGAVVAGNDRASLSGNHAYRFAVRGLGADPDRFAEHRLTGSHRRSLDLLLAGSVDAAVIDSVVLARQRSLDDRVATELAPIEHLGPWPTQPLVAGPTVSDIELAAVRARLLAPPDRALRDALTDAGLTRLEATPPGHCDTVIAALAADVGHDTATGASQ